MAARYGTEECIRLLIKQGANIEAEDKDGRTAVALAAWKRHCKVIKILIDLGANRKTAGKRYSKNVDQCIQGKQSISYKAYNVRLNFKKCYALLHFRTINNP